MTRRYRRSAHVVCYWADGAGVIYNYATAMQARATALTWQILDVSEGWQTPDEVRSHVAPGLDEALIARLLDALVEATFMEASDAERDGRSVAMDRWQAWNPAAGFYHCVSRQCTYGEPGLLDDRLKAKAAGDPMPPSVKPPAGATIALPPVGRTTAVGRAFADRRTWRRFGRTAVDRSSLAQLLRTTAGITHWLSVPGLGEVPMTTSPSGGSRHPIETYALVRRVRGVPAGIYRYAGDRHELELIRAGASREELAGLIPQQPWFAEAGVVLFFTAVYERTQWRYEFPRAYRAVLLEAGHMCQTFLLMATSLGLAPFCTMAIEDARVERLLGVDGVSESVLYAAGAGTRPRSAGRAVMPAEMGAPVVRRNERGAAPRARAGRKR